jgi:DNA-directed RNA polymerase specialized sigma24 family protein
MNKPDLLAVTLGDLATDAEIRAEVEAQTRNPSPRIYAAARAILNHHPKLKIHTTEEDLIGAAYSSVLGERNWNKTKVDFFGHFVGVMRSIASDATRKATHTRAQLTYGHEEFDEVDSVSTTEQDTDLSPEDILIANEEADEQEQRIEKLRKLLVNDKDATSILNLLLEHGLSKSEIREKLGMHDKSFWAADRRLQRAVMKIGET